ncbi:hypothetical protein OYT13_16215 [Pandoraea sp. XJJ-1]|uniref:hypothetical protein n=1 Tax=unclassified Pandoraea TaxID=2624094 RepID=UPI00034BC113|nr:MULTISPECIES: hypothetical protein [unclassified Pandoraea]MBN9115958.1 hypothetical protein [Pandoraea sp.]OJY22607.1 MAG: hypothetical protein BGP02_17455 [Pandoraea sp. 64-18]WAL81388.1 hypothetical protein OYT13_16215 [Pandoraea sp. XJJ-1]BDD93451.1 hypothetical protein PanNE5_28910 [Pandoraea sp. NE5]
MPIPLKNIPRNRELTADEVDPIVANVKYAQRNDFEVAPVVANVKYAQRNDDEVTAVAEAT